MLPSSLTQAPEVLLSNLLWKELSPKDKNWSPVTRHSPGTPGRPGGRQETKGAVAVGAELDSWNSAMTISQWRYLVLNSTVGQCVVRRFQ